MTAKITVDRVDAQTIRHKFVADFLITANIGLPGHGAGGMKAAQRAPSTAGQPGVSRAARDESLTVEETADALHIGRDKVYYRLRLERVSGNAARPR